MTKNYVCSMCGSEHIAFSGFLKWDNYNQCLVPDGLNVLSEDPTDKSQWSVCVTCGANGEGLAKEEEMEDGA